MVVRPIVIYAATVWWPRVKFRTSKAELSKLQRMASLGITGAIRTIPTAAMDVLLGLAPLHLQLEAEAKVEFTDSIAMINGNPNLKVWSCKHDSEDERRKNSTDGD
jgi:hypothetical protein